MGSYKIESNTSCVNEIKIKIKDNVIKLLEFVGGCPIIYQALSKLCLERNVDEIIELLSYIKEPCVNKETCIHQLVDLLQLSKKKEEEKSKEEAEYRISPKGLLNNINTLLSKTNLNIKKDAIAIKVKKHLYNKIKENLDIIKDELKCDIYLDEFNDFNGDYIFSTVGKRKEEKDENE